MSRVSIFGFVTAFVIISFLSGCGAMTGRQFTEFKAPKPEQGLVYVYRPSGIMGVGVSYPIHVTNSSTPGYIAGNLVNGGYVTTYVPVGENEIWAKTESKSSITLDVKEGETYCVRGSVGIGFVVGRPNLEIVDMATCKAEIINTKLTY